MPLPELDNLVRTGALIEEPPNAAEFAGLVQTAEERLRDAEKVENALHPGASWQSATINGTRSSMGASFPSIRISSLTL